MAHKNYTGIDSSIVREDLFLPSTIETIDYALFDWVESLKLHAETNKGWKETKVIWVSAERAFQLKSNKELRDINGILKLPLVTVERTDLTKSPERMIATFVIHVQRNRKKINRPITSPKTIPISICGIAPIHIC